MKPNERMEIVDQLRGLAALAVTWHHLTVGTMAPGGKLMRELGAYGWLGVEVFFVISGFIIPYSLWRGGYQLSRHFFTFLAKRVTRLDPPYLVSIVITILALTAASRVTGHPYEVTWPQLASHLGYVNALLGYEWAQPPYWTLALEFQFYLLAALCFPLFNGRRVVALLSVVVMCLAWLAVPDKNIVLRWGPLFAMGIWTFRFKSGAIDRLAYNSGVVPIAGCVYSSLGMAEALAAGATALAIAYIRPRPSAALSWLGEISYSLYLVHLPIGMKLSHALARSSDSEFVRSGFFVVSMAVSLLTAWAMFRVIELPARRWSSAIKYSA